MGNLYRKVNAIQKYLLSTEGKSLAKEFSDEIASAEDKIDQSRMDEFIDDIARGYGVQAVEKSNGYEVSPIQENKMESKKYKLLENKLRKMIREELNKNSGVLKEEPKDQDLDYLYKILVSAGPKISAALTNLDKVYNQNQRFQRIMKGWNELSFGYGDFYHKVKAGKTPE